MPIALYYTPGSAPCRSVLLTGAALNIDFDLKQMNLLKGEHLTGDLIKINPTHTVPTIKDGEFSLWESRAILAYLAEKYDKRDALNLYPNDPEIRGIINQRLYFDMGTLYASFANYYYPVIFGNESFDPTKYKKIEEAFAFLNTFLESRDKLGDENLYAAADWLTIADLTLAASVATFIICGFQIEAYPFVDKWYNTVKKMPNFEEANIIPLLQFKHLFDNAVKDKK